MPAQLECMVYAARDLKSADSNGFSDPYVKIRLLDKNGGELGSSALHHKWKTATVNKELNPKWGNIHGGRFGSNSWGGEEQAATAIKFSVWDRDLMKSDFLGELVVQLGKEIKSNVGFEAWVPLKNRQGKDDNVSGDLHLSVSWDDGRGGRPNLKRKETFGPRSSLSLMSRTARKMRDYSVPPSLPEGKGGQREVIKWGLTCLVMYAIVSIVYAYTQGDFLSIRVWGMCCAAAGHGLMMVIRSDERRGATTNTCTVDPVSALHAGEGQVEVDIKVRNGSGLSPQTTQPHHTYVEARLNGQKYSGDRSNSGLTTFDDCVNPNWHQSFQFFADKGGYPTKREPFVVTLEIFEVGALATCCVGRCEISLLEAWDTPNLCTRGWYPMKDKAGNPNGEVYVEARFEVHASLRTQCTTATTEEMVYQYQVANAIKVCAQMATPAWEVTDEDMLHHAHGIHHHDEQRVCLATLGKNLNKKIAQTGAMSVVDFAPQAFREIRQHFGISSEDYIQSWNYELSEMPLPKVGAGRSGSLFLFSKDKKFLYKSIPMHEVQTLLDVFENYKKHLLSTPSSILMRFVGLHCVHDHVNNTQFFIGVSTNAVWSPLVAKMDELYDLKGRKPKKSAERQTMVKNSGVWKDNQLRRTFKLGKQQRDALLHSINGDAAFLSENNMMDYSLLVGVQEKEDERLSHSHELSELEGQPYYSGHKEVLFIGIIDFLSRYGAKKIAAHTLKSIVWDTSQLSTIDAKSYAERYTNYFPDVFIDNATADEGDHKDRSQFIAAQHYEAEVASRK